VCLSGCVSAGGHALALYLDFFSAYLELFAEHHDAFIATSDKFLYINSLPALHHTAMVRRAGGRGSVSECALSRRSRASAPPSYGPVLILELYPKPNPKP
jgi:hypothetical protein